MVWEAMYLHKAWKDAEKRGDEKAAKQAKSRYEEWLRTHPPGMSIDPLEERIARIEKILGI